MAAQISPHLLGRPCGHPQGREELGRWPLRSRLRPSSSLGSTEFIHPLCVRSLCVTRACSSLGQVVW